MAIKENTKTKPRPHITYTVEPYSSGGGWFIGGLGGYTSFHDEEDAKLVADALNFSRQYKQLIRKADLLHSVLAEFTGRNDR